MLGKSGRVRVSKWEDLLAPHTRRSQVQILVPLPIKKQWATSKMAFKLSAVLLNGRLDGTGSLGQITWDHYGMYLNLRIQCQEPWLGNRGDL